MKAAMFPAYLSAARLPSKRSAVATGQRFYAIRISTRSSLRPCRGACQRRPFSLWPPSWFKATATATATATLENASSSPTSLLASDVVATATATLENASSSPVAESTPLDAFVHAAPVVSGWARYSPIEQVVSLYHGLHVGAGLSVGLATLAVALAVRVVVFVPIVKSKRYGILLTQARPVLQAYSEQVKTIQASGVKMTKEQVQALSAARDAELDKLHPGLRVTTALFHTLCVASLQLVFFLGTRRYFTYSVAAGGATAGGFVWVPELTLSDPTGALSVIFATVLAAQLVCVYNVMGKGMNGPVVPVFFQMMRVAIFVAPPVSAIVTAFLPSGLVLYFASNAALLLLQTLVVDSPQGRRALKIPNLAPTPRPPKASSNESSGRDGSGGSGGSGSVGGGTTM